MAEFLKIATLDSDAVEKIRALEKSTGSHIMAFKPGLEVADLSDSQMDAVQRVEDDLGVILIVYKK